MQNTPRRWGSQSSSRRRRRRRRFEPLLARLEIRTVLSVVAPPGVSAPNALVNSAVTAAPYGPSQIYQGYAYNRVIFQQGSKYYLGNGAGQTIAIVDAFNDASIAIESDHLRCPVGSSRAAHLQGLEPDRAAASLTGVTNESGARSSATYGWSIEESLDVEWAHTIAPDANIVLFEANNNSNANLYTAVETAAKAATYTQYGLPPAGVVSNSWGGSESSAETASDADFTSVGNTVTFVVSSGDSHPVEYPSSSPNVLAVGGTALHLVTSGFGTNYNGEGWYDTSKSNAGGGGASAYESEPSYQLGVQSSGKRETPDVAMNADGTSDVLVLDTNSPYDGYYGVYGTSEAAPMMAATLAIVDQGLTLAKGTPTTLGNAQAYVYKLPLNNTTTAAYHEPSTGPYKYITVSGSGRTKTTTTTTYTATPGYNTLTGLGSPIPTAFIPDMISYALANGSNPRGQDQWRIRGRQRGRGRRSRNQRSGGRLLQQHEPTDRVFCGGRKPFACAVAVAGGSAGAADRHGPRRSRSGPNEPARPWRPRRRWHPATRRPPHLFPRASLPAANPLRTHPGRFLLRKRGCCLGMTSNLWMSTCPIPATTCLLPAGRCNSLPVAAQAPRGSSSRPTV